MDLYRVGEQNYYIEHFQSEVLDVLDATNVILDFSGMAHGFNVGENDIALICYEKPSDFSHRHLVAEWLNRNGFKCEEWRSNIEKT